MSTVETLKPKMHHSLIVQKNSAFFSLRFNALNGTKALLAHMFRKSIGTLIFSIKPKNLTVILSFSRSNCYRKKFMFNYCSSTEML